MNVSSLCMRDPEKSVGFFPVHIREIITCNAFRNLLPLTQYKRKLTAKFVLNSIFAQGCNAWRKSSRRSFGTFPVVTCMRAK